MIEGVVACISLLIGVHVCSDYTGSVFLILFDVCKCNVFLCVVYLQLLNALLGVLCFVREWSGCVGCCIFCLICDVWSFKCMCVECSGSIFASSSVQPVAMHSAVFCRVIILIVDAIGDHIVVDDIVLIKPLVYWSCMKCLLFWFGFAMGMM